MFYDALADGMGTQPTDPRQRFAAWVEIGLGQWVESSFLGDTGYLEPAKPSPDRVQGLAVLRSRPYGLENMIGLEYGRFHDVTDQTSLHWANAATFVAFLMDRDDTRKQLLEYIDLAYNKSKGNSSSLFDKVFGKRIEALEKPWIQWLELKIGVAAQRRRR